MAKVSNAWGFLFLALALLVPARAADNSEPSLAAVLARDDIRFIIFGEIHGTVEEPRIFGEIVTSAIQTGRPIVVCLEFDTGEQDRMTRYFASNGRSAALRAVISGPGWQVQDGRTSAAMLALLERLRVLAHGNASLKVVTIKPSSENLSAADYEKAMAQNIAVAEAGDEHPLVIALVGNIHAMRSLVVPAKMGWSGASYAPMAMNLPLDATLSIRFNTDGGAAWNCQDLCALHPLGADHPRYRTRFVFFDELWQGYDAVLTVGKVSASPPAKGTPTN